MTQLREFDNARGIEVARATSDAADAAWELIDTPPTTIADALVRLSKLSA